MVDSLSLDQLVDRTASALKAQKMVPLSPGRRIDDEAYLCAGAMLVKEAIGLLRSPGEAGAFADEVITRDSGYIRLKGAEIGLDEDMVDGMIISNDSLSPEDRLEGTLEHFACVRAWRLGCGPGRGVPRTL